MASIDDPQANDPYRQRAAELLREADPYQQQARQLLSDYQQLQPKAPPQPKPAEPGFIPTIKRTGGQMATGVARAIEDIGLPQAISQPIRQYGEGIIQRNPAGITSLEQAAESPWLTVKEAVGQMVPQVGAAGIGATAGGALGGIAGGLIGKSPGAIQTGSKIGRYIGGLLPIGVQEYGGIRDEQIAAGQSDIARALGAAGAATALELLGPESKVIRGLTGLPTKNIARSIGKEALKQAGIEAGTEALQSGVEQIGAFQDPTTRAAIEEQALSALMGGIGGGVVGGGMRGVEAALAPAAQAPQAEPEQPQQRPAEPRTEQPLTLVPKEEPPAPGTPGPLPEAAGPLSKTVNRAVEAGVVPPDLAPAQTLGVENVAGPAGTGATQAADTTRGEGTGRRGETQPGRVPESANAPAQEAAPSEPAGVVQRGRPNKALKPNPEQPVEYGLLKTRGAVENYRKAVVDDIARLPEGPRKDARRETLARIDAAISAADERDQGGPTAEQAAEQVQPVLPTAEVPAAVQEMPQAGETGQRVPTRPVAAVGTGEAGGEPQPGEVPAGSVAREDRPVGQALSENAPDAEVSRQPTVGVGNEPSQAMPGVPEGAPADEETRPAGAAAAGPEQGAPGAVARPEEAVATQQPPVAPEQPAGLNRPEQPAGEVAPATVPQKAKKVELFGSQFLGKDSAGIFQHDPGTRLTFDDLSNDALDAIERDLGRQIADGEEFRVVRQDEVDDGNPRVTLEPITQPAAAAAQPQGEGNAPQEVSQQEGVQPERVVGDEGRNAAEAGSRGGVFAEAGGAEGAGQAGGQEGGAAQQVAAPSIPADVEALASRLETLGGGSDYSAEALAADRLRKSAASGTLTPEMLQRAQRDAAISELRHSWDVPNERGRVDNDKVQAVWDGLNKAERKRLLREANGLGSPEQVDFGNLYGPSGGVLKQNLVDRMAALLVSRGQAAPTETKAAKAETPAASPTTGTVIERDDGKFFVRYGDDRATTGPFRTRKQAEDYAARPVPATPAAPPAPAAPVSAAPTTGETYGQRQEQGRRQETTKALLKPPAGQAPAAEQRPSVLLNAAGKPRVFKSPMAAAKVQREYGNEYKQQRVKGGTILRLKTEAEFAAEAKGAKRLTKGGVVNPESDSLLDAIGKLGGLSMEERNDIIREGNKRAGGGWVFRADGQPIDILASEGLKEYGYVPQEEIDRDGGVRWLKDAIRAEMAGERKHYSEQGSDWMEEAQRQYEARMPDPLDDLTPDQLDESGYTQSDPQTQYDTENLIREARLHEIDTEGLAEDTARATEGGTEDDYHAALQAALAEAIAGARQPTAAAQPAAAGTSPADGGEAAGGAQETPALTLEAPTPEGLQAQAERAAAAQSADQAEQTRLEQKAAADAQRGEFTLTGSNRPADVAAAAGQMELGGESDLSPGQNEPPIAREESKVYAVREGNENYDIFTPVNQSLQLRAAKRARRPRSGKQAAETGNVPASTALSIRKDPHFPGIYHYSTQLVEVGRRDLPVERATNWQEAASALAALRRYAVEHFDVLLTDKNGKPLAVVGAFKGAQSQASVYPSTVLMEALRVKGAARAWGIHNHPSGLASLSVADRHLSRAFGNVFSPSSIKWMGISAVAGDHYESADANDQITAGALLEGDVKGSVPVVERTIMARNAGMGAATSPDEAMRMVADTLRVSGEKPGIVLLDNQHRLTAWITVDPGQMAKLRRDKGFDRLINSASEAGAAAAIISNPNGAMPRSTLDNIASALGLADIRTLDAIDPVKMTSAAQMANEPRATGIVFQRKEAPAAKQQPGFDITDKMREAAPTRVQSYDTLIEQRAKEIADLRAANAGREGRGVLPAGATAAPAAAAQAGAQADTSPEGARNIGMLERGLAGIGGRTSDADRVHPYVATRLPGGPALAQIAQALGQKVQGFNLAENLSAEDKRRFGFFNGAYLRGVTYLRGTGIGRPHLAVLGHELVHRMAKEAPDVYSRFVDAVQPYIIKGKYGEFAGSAVAKEHAEAGKIREEFMGEVMADGFMDKGFWKTVGDKSPVLLRRVVTLVRNLIDSILRSVGYTPQTEKYLTDYRKVLDIAAGSLAEYQRAKAGEVAPAAEEVKFQRKEMPAFITGGSQALQSAASKFTTYAPDKTIREKFDSMRTGWLDRLIQKTADAYLPLKKLSPDAYIQARMVKAADGALEGALLYGKPKLNDDGGVSGILDGGGFLPLMQKLNGEHDRFLMWVAGNRSARLMAEGRENLFTADEIKAMTAVNQGKMADGRDRVAVYDDIQRQFNAFNSAVLDFAQKAGIVNAEDRKNWQQYFYVPFFRAEDDQTIEGPTAMVRGLVNQKGIIRLKGGREGLGDMMHNTMLNWSHLLSASMANVAAEKALEAAVGVGAATQLKEADAREYSKLASGQPVYYMSNGQKRWFAVTDPAILSAITALEANGLKGPAMKLMQQAKYWLTLGATIAPAFKIRNLLRDTVAAPGVSPLSYNVLSNVMSGWKGTKKISSHYQQMVFSGAAIRFGTLIEGNRGLHAKHLIESGIKDQTILNTQEKIKAAWTKWYDAWQEFGDRMENVNRSALYDQLLKKGMTPRDAAFHARDFMDFSLHGSSQTMRILTQTVPFLNARVQGLYKLGRAYKDDRKRLATMTGAVMATSVLLLAMYHDDDDWKQREDWDRDFYWWMKVPGTQLAYRIPKPFEIGALGTIAERTAELLFSDEMNGARYRERIKQMFGQTFAFNPVPQLFKPMVDLYANKDSFTGRDIETFGMEGLSKPQRYGPNTTELAKLLGKAGDTTGASPAQIDFVIRAYLGWLGTIAADAVSGMLAPTARTERPASRWDDWAARFVKELPETQSRYATEFYQSAKEARQLMTDLRAAREQRDVEQIKELMADPRMRTARMFQTQQRRFTEITKQMRVVRGNPDMDGDEKRQRLDALTQRRNALAKMVMEQAQRAQAQ